MVLRNGPIPCARMLVVDDIPEILPLFETAAAACRVARLGTLALDDSCEAARIVGEEPFDVVIADYRMPRLDGLDVLAAARLRHPEGVRVLTSGFHEPRLPARKMAAARPHRYLQKPVTGRELTIFLEQLLAAHFPATMRITSPSCTS